MKPVSKFEQFRGVNIHCPKCAGTGGYMYDHNHGKICELCCSHPEGFKELDPEYWPDSKGKAYCVFGCGAERDIVNDSQRYHGK
jgi:hypothetical protein